MVARFIDFLKTARPRQWVKNLTLYAGLIFTGNVLSDALWWVNFWTVTEAVAAFTLVAVSIYFLNDLVDIKGDQAHPFKKFRPVAMGRISKTMATAVFLVAGAVGLGWAKSLSPLFFLTVLGYWSLQILYSIYLKNVEVADVFIIALGFFLRVLAGAIVIDAHLSIWFLLCVISVSLFLAAGKRRAELAILTEKGAAAHRKVMGKYTTDILDRYVGMFATSSYLSWALYTFNFYEQAPSLVPSSLILLSRTLTINKWLMATIPVVIFGIMRYIRIIYDGARAETPEKVILSDLPLLLAVAMWGAIVVSVLYLGPS
ncbi:MAG: UbiA prenyltransferase [Candidatus Amesbacteria bacterium GW2011_GWA2_47_11b]|uniref:UbiA prenyltransferase n=3 Tax=Candidatus Amesiibacteriota TaxID=1752730 RepID=A0A0G1VDL4_9BACT|nr:MAG: UbiA prenyltransferase [Microgenomates group bacterium GW2011_GWC1_46_20]KKU58052.1 MAG: UbiA prenyltransferase [Candidatus Amesbacteria bacterium GW2011_GWA2_47_11b]KKU68090.1 MAG: UbiA prenyltransferase [Candidatus Amesbacteria bacterium GW2011_GWA1_47_20]KKU83510.1 MAG: UbiA prenyltransferase [Candidatus Amesbacteria bacterium GW2011_GWC2_47_8]